MGSFTFILSYLILSHWLSGVDFLGLLLRSILITLIVVLVQIIAVRTWEKLR